MHLATTIESDGGRSGDKIADDGSRKAMTRENKSANIMVEKKEYVRGMGRQKG